MTESGEPPIGELLIDALDAVLYFDKKKIVEADGVRLHPGEVHVLACAVHGKNFTQIAEQFGISKGAVSQTFGRLARRGVLVVDKDRSRKNAAVVTLTPLGEALLERIVALRGRLSGELSAVLEGYSAAELRTVRRFALDMRTFVRRSLVAADGDEGDSRASDGEKGDTRRKSRAACCTCPIG